MSKSIRELMQGSKAKIIAKAREGQVLILMMLLTTTLIILFGMVVAVGHLVQARMSLQNAVDLAAMVGASHQARHLNHISLVNYRFRQNYKALLYDLYVTSSRFNQGLINEAGGGGVFERIPANTNGITYGICRNAYGYVPSMMGRFAPPGARATAQDTDMCKNAVGQGQTIRAIEPYFGPLVNPGLIAINNTIIALRGEQERLCNEARAVNLAYYQYAMDLFGRRQRVQMNELLSRLEPFQSDFGPDTDVIEANSAPAPATMYATLVSNLIGALRPENGTKLTVEWLNPRDTRSFWTGGQPLSNVVADILAGRTNLAFAKYFDTTQVSVDVSYIDFQWSNAGCRASVRNTRDTGNTADPAFVGIGRSRTRPDGGPPRVPLGVAIKATVRNPRLLFWPQGLTPTLTAIGAAKPFGSRIGPPVQQTNGELAGRGQFQNQYVGGGETSFSFYPGDIEVGGRRSGVGHKVILQALYQALGPAQRNGQNVVQPRAVDTNECVSGGTATGFNFLCYSLAPTLYEALFFNAYPYPPNRAYNYPHASGLEAFPEIPIRAADGFADHPERSDSYTEKNHYTTAIGQEFNQAFGIGAQRPVFFADGKVLRSSWSPALNPATDDTFLSGWGPSMGIGGGFNVGRMGYQIKLTSVFQLCREIQIGGGSSLSASLAALCPSAGSGDSPQAGRDILH